MMSDIIQRQGFHRPGRAVLWILHGAMVAWLAGIVLATASDAADPSHQEEYGIKAAFLYNFAQFVDWPARKGSDNNDTIVIGILGKDPFGNAFEPVLGKRIHGRKLVVKNFKGISAMRTKEGIDEVQFAQEATLWRRCHLMFLCSSEVAEKERIFKSLEGYSVLTVGETEKFVDLGGMIGFIPNEEKTRFEVNLEASKKENLTISASVLRLAKRVIQKAPSTP
jgi:hypothetical protein